VFWIGPPGVGKRHLVKPRLPGDQPGFVALCGSVFVQVRDYLHDEA
jgi:hypothetical protein